jgi:hypothetical protein
VQRDAAGPRSRPCRPRAHEPARFPRTRTDRRSGRSPVR